MMMVRPMRTTLDIEDDVLAIAKELARAENLAVGKVISRLVRDALTGRGRTGSAAERIIGGFRPFPARGHIVTNATVDALRDEDGL